MKTGLGMGRVKRAPTTAVAKSDLAQQLPLEVGWLWLLLTETLGRTVGNGAAIGGGASVGSAGTLCP